ncbi:hypothetical protein [Sodaliphilus sp.]|uniref:hypothetical protein n=1 Tax=Sodaliphilus sp. TaxID=2815818 RepID=UPI003890DA8C
MSKECPAEINGMVLESIQLANNVVYIHLKFENLETDEISGDVLNELVSELKTQFRKFLGIPSYIEFNSIISNKYNEKLVTI